jgi:hypothetical protein
MRRFFLQALSMAVVIWGGVPPVRAEDPPPPPVDLAKVDMAIRKGAEWLEKHAWQPGADKAPTRPGELDWLTRQAVVVRAVRYRNPALDNPEFKKWADAIRREAPRTTLEAALRAHAFNYASMNPVQSQNDLLAYALFLADNQAQDGSWGSGKVVDPPPASMLRPVPTVPPERRGGLPLRRVRIGRRVQGEPGDVYHSGLALFGWAACQGWGLTPEPAAMTLAEKRLGDSQNEDGGWGERKGEPSQLTATALGMGGLSICLRLSLKVPDRDERVQKAARWLGANLKYEAKTEVDGSSRWFWLFCVKVAGEYAGIEWFDRLSWYKDGVDWLLTVQREDGSWGLAEDEEARVLDTCWAMMFLWRPLRTIHY